MYDFLLLDVSLFMRLTNVFFELLFAIAWDFFRWFFILFSRNNKMLLEHF